MEQEKKLEKVTLKLESVEECEALKEIMHLYGQAYDNGDDTASDLLAADLESLLE